MFQSLRLFGILTFRQVAQHHCSDTACNRAPDKLSSGNPVHFLYLSFIRYGRMQSYKLGDDISCIPSCVHANLILSTSF